MVCRVAVKDFHAAVADHKQTVQNAKIGRRYREEVQRRDRLPVIVQKYAPAWAGISGPILTA